MKQIYANNLTTLSLGRQGENLARQVVFDIRDLESLYGSGTVEVIHQRPGDAQPYPLAVQRDGTLVTWDVTATDTEMSAATANERYGKCELRYYAGETLAKSQIWRTWVESAMGTPSETTPPEPEQGWVDQVVAVGATAKASADAAKADADRAAAMAAEVAKKAAQTAQDASDAAKAMEAAQTAQRLAEEAQGAAETARTAAEAAQAAAEQSATDAAGAKQDAETAQKAAQDAAAAAAKALADIRTMYQEMQTWAQGVIQDVDAAGSAAVQSVQSAGDAQVQRVTDEGTTQTANAKAQADAAALSAADAAQSAQEAAESAAVYDNVVADVTQLKQDISTSRFGDPYDGIDLSVKFADEIAAFPYSGDAWAWIKARIRAGNYTGIHVKDFIPFATTNGFTLRAEVAGIDTYRNYGDRSVGRHIDFICRELWPTLKPINPVNYNNGLIPVENITLDGVATSYTLTKKMNGVASITKGGERLTGWHYDSSTFTITFDEVPEAGTVVVTGTGTEHPWLACDLYHWLNSLSGQIPNGTGLNPAVKHVDYTQGGVYFYLPQALKNVIIEKRFLLAKRYSATGILSDDNSWGWTNIGKLWLPTEPEVYGMPVWGGKGGYSLGGSAVQYPIFMGNMNRLKYRSGNRANWWLLYPSTSSTRWCTISSYGATNYDGVSYTNVATPVCFRIG